MTQYTTSKPDPTSSQAHSNHRHQEPLSAESLGIFIREALVVLTLVALLIGSAYSSKAPPTKTGDLKKAAITNIAAPNETVPVTKGASSL